MVVTEDPLPGPEGVPISPDPQILRLKDAAELGEKRLVGVWQSLLSEGEVSPAARLHMAETLIGLARPDQALEVLGSEASVRARQLTALALDKRGQPEDVEAAIEILLRLYREGRDDGSLAETGGLLAGRYKKLGRKQSNPGLLDKAFGIYRETWESTRDTYPGINAAALALELGRKDESRRLARAVVEELEALDRSEMSPWHYATFGEAHLLLADPTAEDALDTSRDWYGLAVRSDPNAVQSIAVMRQQARIELGLLGFPEEALDDLFQIRSVVAFTGHLMDDPDRDVPRFPASMEGAVRRALRDRLRQGRVGFGITSGGCGGDILFLEELLERGGSATVVLPFPLDDFVSISVGDWEPRLRAILADPRTRVVEISPSRPPDEQLSEAFAACNDRIRDEARRLASQVDQEPRLMALWDGRTGDGVGGTADAVDAWERAGLQVERIDLPQPTPVIRTGPPVGAAPEGAQPSTQEAPGRVSRGIEVEDEDEDEIEDDVESSRFYESRVCLAIGIDGYVRPWPDLTNAERDAREVARILRERHGFARVIECMGKDATRDGICDAVYDDLIPSVGEDDLVVIYYAGHGFIDPTAQVGYLVPTDARGQREGSMISKTLLGDWSTRLKCRHLLLVFDSCFSGMIIRLAGNVRRDPLPDQARLAISSGRQTETVSDGTGEHSPFAEAFLSAMSGGIPNANRKGLFTATELYAFLEARVHMANPRQRPMFAQLANHEGGEILFNTSGI
jgi:tetratricopeptide (TPR) repeat protein